MRWRWWRPEPEPDGPAGWPGPPARLPDPPYRPEPAEHGGVWMDLLPGYEPGSALTGPTEIVPTVTPAQQYRSRGGHR